MPTIHLQRWLSRTVAVSLLLIANASCAPNGPPPLRVGINAWPGYEFIYLADQKGFFTEAGIEVRVVEFSSLADARRAYERGQLDAVATTVVEVLQIHDQSDRHPRIVRVIDYSAGADVILAHPRIQSTADLKGARIGVELASLGVYILARGLESSGLELSQVTPVAGDQLSMEEQFDRGELDAVVTYPPASVKMLAGRNAHVVFSTAEIPGEVLDVLAVEASVLETRAKDIDRMVRAIDRAMAYERTAPEDAHRIMAEREGLAPSEFALALRDGMTLVGEPDQPEYFGERGRLHEVVRRTDAVLRATRQLTSPTRSVRDVIHDRPLGMKAAP